MLNNLIDIHAVAANVCPIHGIDTSGNISFASEATSEQRAAAQAIVDGWLTDDPAIISQVDAAKLAKLRATAKQFQDDQQAQNVALRVTVKLLVDELNTLRQWLTDFKAATAAAGSLSALKNGVAALPNTPNRTYAQAKTAINNLIDGE